MAHTYSALLFHLIWSTKGRVPFISHDLKPRLYSYLREVASKRGSSILNINGMPDHVQILLSLKPTVMVADMIRDLKCTSSKYMRQTLSYTDFAWQDGYGAFSVGLSTLQTVNSYIDNQEKHHTNHSFEEEFISFLKAQNITYNSRFVME